MKKYKKYKKNIDKNYFKDYTVINYIIYYVTKIILFQKIFNQKFLSDCYTIKKSYNLKYLRFQKHQSKSIKPKQRKGGFYFSALKNNYE